MEDLKYELLSPQDYQQFREVFHKAFGRTPDLQSMNALIAKDKNEIVAFVCIYLTLVVDSMWVKPEWRLKGICKKLFAGIRNLPWKIGHGYYIFASRKRESAMAKKFGASKLPYELWCWKKG